MTETDLPSSKASTRRLRKRAALLSGALLFACGTTASAETRSLSFFNTHTQERTTVTYKRDGAFDPAGLKQINHVLRDWRRDEEVRMDPELLDLIWQVYQETGATSPISIVCGYRAPETNNMLRGRSRGVAKQSQHMLGKALDFFIPGVPLEKLRAVGMQMQFGGVGFYPSSNFVHLDVGSVRAWPRMSRDQLVRLFPDGRTLHQPADGGSLPGYNLAMADFQRKHPGRQRADWAEDDEGVARPAGVNDRVVASTSEGSSTRISNDPAPPPVVAADTGRGRLPPRMLPAPQSVQPAPAAMAMAVPTPAPRGPAATGAIAPAAGWSMGSAPLPLAKPDPQMVAFAQAATPRAKPSLAPEAPVVAYAAPRPTRNAMDAAAVLAGDQAPVAPRLLGYAPEPGMMPSPAEATGSLAQGGFGRTVVAALAPTAMPQPSAAEAATTRAAAPKANRADPMARLVSYVTERPDPALLTSVSLDRAGGSTNLRHPDQGAVAPLMTKPQRVLAAGFGSDTSSPASGFAGPAVVALRSLNLQ